MFTIQDTMNPDAILEINPVDIRALGYDVDYQTKIGQCLAPLLDERRNSNCLVWRERIEKPIRWSDACHYQACGIF